MIASLKRLWRDRRGNALIVAGAALPMLVGAAGLATDTIQWTLWKRELQRAADSAAFSGAYALAMGDTASPAVNKDLDNNYYFRRPSVAAVTGARIALTAEPTVAFPTPPATYTNAVQVTISMRKRLGFASMFMTATPTITATATAAQVPSDEYCLITLKRTGGAALKFSGNPTINLGCGAISDSDTNPSVDTGGTYTLNAPVVAGVGTLPNAITGVTKLRPHQVPMADPFASQYSTSVPAGMSCQTFNQHASNGSGPKTLTPGCYTSFAPNGGGNYTMQPGVYYLQNTDMTLNGNDVISGTGVTIIFTGDTPGGPKMNGNATVNLAAPTDPTNPYYKMLFIQASNAATENGSTINGTSGSSFDGTMYFPKGQLTFNGTSGAMTKCAMVVSYTAIFAGNTNLQNDLTGCTASQKKRTKAIRLIG